MKRKYRISSLLLFLAILIVPCFGDRPPLLAQAAAPGERASSKHILVITSQPYVTQWFTALSNAFTENIYTVFTSQTKVSYEYIDSRIISDPDFLSIFQGLLRKKYQRLKIDLVIGVMPTSSGFLLDYGEQIFPGIPKLYVLPGKEQLARILSGQKTGLVESTSDIPGTLKRIRTLFPETENLFVVGGMAADDFSYLEQARRAVEKLGWPARVTYLTGTPPRELADELSLLPKRLAILMLLYVKDREGNPCTTVQIMDAVAPRANAPVFGFYDTIFGHGIIGGHLTSAESYGKATAMATIMLLSGAPAERPVRVNAEIRDMYDWRQMERWGISPDRLPPGSIIRYRSRRPTEIGLSRHHVP